MTLGELAFEMQHVWVIDARHCKLKCFPVQLSATQDSLLSTIINSFLLKCVMAEVNLSLGRRDRETSTALLLPVCQEDMYSNGRSFLIRTVDPFGSGNFGTPGALAEWL